MKLVGKISAGQLGSSKAIHLIREHANPTTESLYSHKV